MRHKEITLTILVIMLVAFAGLSYANGQTNTEPPAEEPAADETPPVPLVPSPGAPPGTANAAPPAPTGPPPFPNNVQSFKVTVPQEGSANTDLGYLASDGQLYNNPACTGDPIDPPYALSEGTTVNVQGVNADGSSIANTVNENFQWNANPVEGMNTLAANAPPVLGPPAEDGSQPAVAPPEGQPSPETPEKAENAPSEFVTSLPEGVATPTAGGYTTTYGTINNEGVLTDGDYRGGKLSMHGDTAFVIAPNGAIWAYGPATIDPNWGITDPATIGLDQTHEGRVTLTGATILGSVFIPSGFVDATGVVMVTGLDGKTTGNAYELMPNNAGVRRWDNAGPQGPFRGAFYTLDGDLIASGEFGPSPEGHPNEAAYELYVGGRLVAKMVGDGIAIKFETTGTGLNRKPDGDRATLILDGDGRGHIEQEWEGDKIVSSERWSVCQSDTSAWNCPKRVCVEGDQCMEIGNFGELTYGGKTLEKKEDCAGDQTCIELFESAMSGLALSKVATGISAAARGASAGSGYCELMGMFTSFDCNWGMFDFFDDFFQNTVMGNVLSGDPSFLCSMWSDDDMAGDVALGPGGVPAAWAAGEKFEIDYPYINDEGETKFKTQTLYKITFEVNPAAIVEDCDEPYTKYDYVEFTVELDGYIIDLDYDGKRSKNDTVRIRCNSGAYSATGGNTIIRYLNRTYSQVCVDFATGGYRYNDFFKQSMSGGSKVCNKIADGGSETYDFDCPYCVSAFEGTGFGGLDLDLGFFSGPEGPSDPGENRPNIGNPT